MIGEMTDREMEAVLRSEIVARLGCHAEGRTYVVPITYAFDGTSLIGHSRLGLKVDMMRQNPFVCVEVDQIEDPGHWRSVIARGRYDELEGEAAIDAMERLVARFESLDLSETSRPSHGMVEALEAGEGWPDAVAYRIHLEEMTGRYERR